MQSLLLREDDERSNFVSSLAAVHTTRMNGSARKIVVASASTGATVGKSAKIMVLRTKFFLKKDRCGKNFAAPTLFDRPMTIHSA
jgi:hypothetical protein